MFKVIFSALGILAVALPVSAQTFAAGSGSAQHGSMLASSPEQTGTDPVRSLELSTGAQRLTNGFGNWRDVTLKGAYGLDKHLLQGELSAHRRFGEDGVFLGLSDTYTFNEDWYGSLAVGAGDGAFYLPRYRVDGTIYRKLLPNRNLVASLGLGYYKAPGGNSDQSVSLGAAYYFEAPWIVEGGIRLNRSSPGSVGTQQQFVAVTYGRNKQDLVTARYGWGEEGYLAVAANRQLVNFESREASVSWRHWFNPRTGVLVGANRYSNPSYRRSGVTVGVFHDF
jgi:YaiO family outer membrane protein